MSDSSLLSLFLSFSLYPFFSSHSRHEARIFSTNVIHPRGIMTRLVRAQRAPFNEEPRKEGKKNEEQPTALLFTLISRRECELWPRVFSSSHLARAHASVASSGRASTLPPRLVDFQCRQRA